MLRRILRRTLLAVLALAVLVGAFALLTAGTAPGRGGLEGAEARAAAWRGEPPLRALADRVGLRFGSAVMVRDVRRDPGYAPVLVREFNSVTPFVEMKWGTLHPEPGRYDFDLADELVALAEAHDMRVRGHTLVYGQVIDPPNPAYLLETTDPGRLRALMADHIATVAGRYAGRVDVYGPLPHHHRDDDAARGHPAHLRRRVPRQAGRLRAGPGAGRGQPARDLAGAGGVRTALAVAQPRRTRAVAGRSSSAVATRPSSSAPRTSAALGSRGP